MKRIILVFFFLLIVCSYQDILYPQPDNEINVKEKYEDLKIIYSNDSNWNLLQKAVLSNYIFEYPPNYYFKFSKNNILYTIYYEVDIIKSKVERKIFKGSWNIDFKKKIIYIKIINVIGKVFIKGNFKSFKLYFGSDDQLETIVLYKGIEFKEPNTDEEQGYYSSTDYFIFGVAKKVYEEEDMEYLKRL